MQKQKYGPKPAPEEENLKKQKRRLDRSSQRFCCSFLEHRSVSKGVAVLACTRSNRRFCIPMKCPAGTYFSGQHPKSFHYSFCTRRCMVPLGFCSVAFPPPPVTLPATRPNVLRPERLASYWLITSKRSVARFYPNNSEIFRPPSKPFGFDSGRTMITDVRYLLSLERCVTASVPPPGVGQNARKQSRL